MTDHTAGPYTAEQLAGIRKQFERNKGQNDAVKARWVEAYGGGLLLMAESAPDMYEALRDIEGEMNYWENTDEPMSQGKRREIADIASNAIAKAEGETP